MPDSSSRGRRKALKTIAFSGSVAASFKGLPNDWKVPVIDAVVLPAHAQTSPADGFQASCSIPFDLTFSGTPEGPPGIANVYNGTQSAGGPFFGNCDDSGIQFDELPLVVTIASQGGDQYAVNYNLDSGLFTFDFVATITELNVGFMGSTSFQFVNERDFNLNGFPALEETTYEFSIGAGAGLLSGSINGVVQVNENIKSGP